MNTKKNFYQVFTLLKTPAEAEKFLRDLLTPEEIEEFAKRFAIAQLLWGKKDSYVAIAKKVGTSTTTVTRVARFLWKEPHKGYQVMLRRLFKK